MSDHEIRKIKLDQEGVIAGAMSEFNLATVEFLLNCVLSYVVYLTFLSVF